MKNKLQNKRYVLWRRSIADLRPSTETNEPAISTLSAKIAEAIDIVEGGDYDTVLVLEIKKVVTTKANVTVKEFN
jgi:hypothetical protein